MINLLFHQLEEKEIHERAETYAMSCEPDEDYYILPRENFHCVDPHYLTHGQETIPVHRSKRRRTFITDSCILTHHNQKNKFDNTRHIPIGQCESAFCSKFH